MPKRGPGARPGRSHDTVAARHKNSQSSPTRRSGAVQPNPGQCADSFTYVILPERRPERCVRGVRLSATGVVSINCRQDYPAYTGWRRSKRPWEIFPCWRGACSAWRSRPPNRLSVPSSSSGDHVHSPVPLPVQASDPTRLLGQIAIPASGLNAFSVELVDQEGMASKDSGLPRRGPSRQSPHRPANLSDAAKRSGDTGGEADCGMDVSDDFSHRQDAASLPVEPGRPRRRTSVGMDLAGEQPSRLQRQFVCICPTFRPPVEGARSSIWLEAEDNNTTTGPRRRSQRPSVARWSVSTRSEPICSTAPAMCFRV